MKKMLNFTNLLNQKNAQHNQAQKKIKNQIETIFKSENASDSEFLESASKNQQKDQNLLSTNDSFNISQRKLENLQISPEKSKKTSQKFNNYLKNYKT